MNKKEMAGKRLESEYGGYIHRAVLRDLFVKATSHAKLAKTAKLRNYSV